MAAHVHRLAAPRAYAAGFDRKVKGFTLWNGGFPPPARLGFAPVYPAVPPKRLWAHLLWGRRRSRLRGTAMHAFAALL